MSLPYRVVAGARLGTESAGAAEPLHLVGMALHSAHTPGQLVSRLCSTLAALLRAERCIVIEGSDPADPHFEMVKEAFAKKEALQLESTSSTLCAPLFSREHPEGALIVERATSSPFGVEELKLVATLAPQAALALHNVRLYDRATEDPLTALANRQRFTAELEDAIAVGGPVSLLLVDFDHFRDKIDVYGRAIGDRVLSEFGEVLSGRLALAACVSRTGDDEFCAVLPGLDAPRARDLAEDLRRAVETYEFDAKHEGLRCTVSVGVAEHRTGEMAGMLFTRASEALASAKRAGRNRVDVAR